jgi:CheY-like chemotaxis protein
MIRVLCIHEETTALMLRKKILESMGLSVCCASSGLDGLLQFRVFVPDLVILDYELRDVGGDVVAWGMRRVNPEIPILMFTASACLPPTATSNVNACFLKHDSPQHFVAKIQELLGSANAMAA